MSDVIHWNYTPRYAPPWNTWAYDKTACGGDIDRSECSLSDVTCPDCLRIARQSGTVPSRPGIGAVVAMVAAGRWAVAQRSAIEDILGFRLPGAAREAP